MASNTKKDVLLKDVSIRSRLSQTIVLSSQTNKIKLSTTFSHSFGQKNYRKLKIEKFCPFFKPAQAVQNFTIKHTYLKKGQLENLIFFKISTVKKWIFFFDINFVWKICSFEVNFVDATQKLREGQGAYSVNLQ